MAQKCVHNGCERTFTDPDELCRYHPGPPDFHDAQKGWKCCKPRVLTWEEWKTIPGCTEGKHSTTDLPPKIEKKEAGDPTLLSGTAGNVSATPALLRAPILVPQPAPTRATSPAPKPKAKVAAPESEDDDPSIEIPDGRVCRRKGCNASYTKGQERSGDENCIHHPGATVFHEGSKGYSCCKRRVLEFDQFMKIEGCKTKPRHLFIGSGKKDAASTKAGKATESGGEDVLEELRHNFFQSKTMVTASFYLPNIDKDRATVVFRAQHLDLDLPTTDSPTTKRYKAEVPLFGPIDTTKSKFRIDTKKLEVTLAKASADSWEDLRR